MRELVMRGGHHGAFCTWLAEVKHKYNIKLPARLARTYNDRNLSQDKMLQSMLTQEIYGAAIACSASIDPVVHDSSSEINDPVGPAAAAAAAAAATAAAAAVDRSPRDRLRYMEEWCQQTSQPGKAWQSVFLSKKARITRGEVLNVVCRKLCPLV